MRILHLLYESRGDPFGIGGVGIRAYEIYGRLKDRHDVTLLCKKYCGAIDGTKEGLEHVFVGAESMNLTRTLLTYAYYAALYVKKHGDEYDVVIEDFSPAIPTFLHFFSAKPVILQVQGHTGGLYFRKYNPLYAAILALLELVRPRYYDNFIFISPETAGKVSLQAAKRVAIISNGVPSRLLEIPYAEGDYVLYLGRIDIYGKGLDILLGAYSEFYKSFPGIRLIVAGDGRDMESFKEMLNGLPEGVAKNIELAGWVSDDRKPEVVRRALFVVFPSRHEVQPIAVLEAMACGKPVVVSGIPEFGFVTKSGAGISFGSGDAVSLADAMKRMAAGEERKGTGLRGREWVRGCTWDRIAKEYECFLDQVVADRK
jgi:glycosyltransferase involved in cell wall biosynthesis